MQFDAQQTSRRSRGSTHVTAIALQIQPSGRLAETFEFAVPSVRVDVVARDPDDNRVLEATLAGAAEVVVTGDSDLLEMDSFEGIGVINAEKLLRTLV